MEVMDNIITDENGTYIQGELTLVKIHQLCNMLRNKETADWNSEARKSNNVFEGNSFNIEG